MAHRVALRLVLALLLLTGADGAWATSATPGPERWARAEKHVDRPTGRKAPGPPRRPGGGKREALERLEEQPRDLFEGEWEIRTECPDCEDIAQEARAKLGEIRYVHEQAQEAHLEWAERGEPVWDAQEWVDYLTRQVRNLENRISALVAEHIWEESRIRNEERVREVEAELTRTRQRLNDVRADLLRRQEALREAQAARAEAEARRDALDRRVRRLLEELEALLRELIECEARCGRQGRLAPRIPR